MTDEHHIAGPTGTSLMILKGVVWGMGGLLILGTLLIAVKLSTGFSKTVVDEPLPAFAGPAAVVDLTDMPALPISQGDQIVSVSAGEGMLFVIVERPNERADGQPLQKVWVSRLSGDKAWRELPTMMVAP